MNHAKIKLENGCEIASHPDSEGAWHSPLSLTLASLQFTIRRINIKKCFGASLVVQWLRIRLPMQGTRVRALVWEDPTCRGATRPVSHNY